MADITMCLGSHLGSDCEMAGDCYRTKAHATPYSQSYFAEPPWKGKDGAHSCLFFWPLTPRKRARFNDLGACLRDARKAKGLTQVELVEASGRSYQAIQRYEQAARRDSTSDPSVSVVEDVCAALNVSVTFDGKWRWENEA